MIQYLSLVLETINHCFSGAHYLGHEGLIRIMKDPIANQLVINMQ